MSDDSMPQPSGRKLSAADAGELHDAILDGYRDIDRLVILIRYKWGIRLADFVYLERPAGKVVFDLIEWADEEGRGYELLALVWQGNPGNPEIARIGERLLGPLAPIAARYDADQRAAMAAPVPVTAHNLEKLVTDRSPLVDFADFQAKLQRVGAAICRIDAAGSRGTGFLIGRQTVLTNYHVMKNAIVNDAIGDQIACRFDFEHLPDGSDSGGTVIPVLPGTGWRGKWSPYSQSDLTGQGAPAENELDFAVIGLAAPVTGRDPLPLPDKPPIVAPMDIAIIAQHAGGEPLALAMGVVLEFPASGLRYRYNTTTQGGSSGAPMLSAGLDLVGLHHAADRETVPAYNQAVPIARILTALRRDDGTLPPL